MNKYRLILESMTEAKKKSADTEKKPWHDKIGRKLWAGGTGAEVAAHLLPRKGKKYTKLAKTLAGAGVASQAVGIGTGVGKYLGGYYNKEKDGKSKSSK